MFSPEVHKEALIRLMAKLRSAKPQSRMAFDSNISREYIRCLEKGEKKPSVQTLIALIAASELDMKSTLCEFVDMLNEENDKFKANVGIDYVRNLKKDSKPTNP